MPNASNIGSNILSSLGQMVGGLATTAVQTVLNSMWPKDFELYMVSLELTDYRDDLIDYITFPVNPDSIKKTEPYVKNIARASDAIVVNSTPMFVPQDISIHGNFGRSFKVLMRTSGFSDSFRALVTTTNKNGKSVKRLREDEISPFYKSGYGCLKVLQSICSESALKDNGKSRRLYFHNFMLGESYLVEVLSMEENMAMTSNMIWEYDLSLKVISPINLSKGKRMALTATGMLQNTITDVVDSCIDAVSASNWW